MAGKFKVGDIIQLEATGYFAPHIECVVVELTPEGDILKIRAVEADEMLATVGFFLEGEDYVAIQWQISPN